MHVVQRVERLRVELEAHALCDDGVLGQAQIQIPAVLAAKLTAAAAGTVSAQNKRPKVIEDGCWI